MHAGFHMMTTVHPTRSLTRAIALILCAFIPAVATAAQPDFGAQRINSTLTASADPAPNTTFILAVNLTLDDHWHTYWPGINDTGYGLSFEIAPIEGLTFGDPYFPTPTRYLAAGDILDHVYEDQLTVLIPVTVSKDLALGTTTIIDITTNALVCDEVCIPQTTNATLNLTISETATVRDPKIEGAYQIRATKLTDPELKWSRPATGTTDYAAILTIKNATHYQFFPADSCTQPADLIMQGDTKASHLTISFDRTYDEPDDPVRFAGRLRVKMNNAWHVYDIDESIQP